MQNSTYKNPHYMGVDKTILLEKNVLSADDLAWIDSGQRVPYADNTGAWVDLLMVQKRVKAAIDSGVVDLAPREVVVPTKSVQIIGDYINGPGGAVQNQADGKMYDSKSQYYKAVKAAGCVVLGNDTPKEAKGPTANICEKELKRDIAQAINQLGG